MAFGVRSRYVGLMRPTMTNIGHNIFLHGEPNGLDAFTPIGDLVGSITPGDLHYVSSHGSVPPDIDPRQHRLVISGMVERPLVLTLDELMRLPSVTRVHYIECVVNRPTPVGRTLEQMHGMTACSEWTGVPLSVLLNEVGVKAGANWVYAEGAETIRLGNSMPLGKAEDCIVAYGQNGEPVRPHQGYPLRLVVPGFQGKYSVKWLRRIRLVKRPLITYWEKLHFLKVGEPDEGELRGKLGDFYLEQGPKSVITFPSGEQRLSGPGYYTISGLAWSGSGAVRRVEVSTDGGHLDAHLAVRNAGRFSFTVVMRLQFQPFLPLLAMVVNEVEHHLSIFDRLAIRVPYDGHIHLSRLLCGSRVFLSRKCRKRYAKDKQAVSGQALDIHGLLLSYR